MSRFALRMMAVMAMLTFAPACFAEARIKQRKPITIGPLIVNADDIIAVYRSADQQPVEVFIGKPGHAIQVIVFHDFRESIAVFDSLWNNGDVTKEPGDDDVRPLTRMKVKDSARGPTTLICNVSRLLAIVHHPDSREIHIFLDRGAVAFPLPDPVNNTERDYLELKNSNGEADIVMAAYRECLGEK